MFDVFKAFGFCLIQRKQVQLNVSELFRNLFNIWNRHKMIKSGDELPHQRFQHGLILWAIVDGKDFLELEKRQMSE